MHRHGGMYADLDVEALRDMTPLLTNETRPVFSAMQVTLPPRTGSSLPRKCSHARRDARIRSGA